MRGRRSPRGRGSFRGSWRGRGKAGLFKRGNGGYSGYYGGRGNGGYRGNYQGGQKGGNEVSVKDLCEEIEKVQRVIKVRILGKNSEQIFFAKKYLNEGFT